MNLVRGAPTPVRLPSNGGDASGRQHDDPKYARNPLQRDAPHRLFYKPEIAAMARRRSTTSPPGRQWQQIVKRRGQGGRAGQEAADRGRDSSLVATAATYARLKSYVPLTGRPRRRSTRSSSRRAG